MILEENDSKKMIELVAEPWFQRVLQAMQEELAGKKSQLAEVDFTDSMGVLKATKLQGEIAGMARYLDFLAEIQEVETE